MVWGTYIKRFTELCAKWLRTTLSKGYTILGSPLSEEGSTADCRNAVHHWKNQIWIKTKKEKNKSSLLQQLWILLKRHNFQILGIAVTKTTFLKKRINSGIKLQDCVLQHDNHSSKSEERWMSLHLEACSTWSQSNAPKWTYVYTVKVGTHTLKHTAILLSYPKHLYVDSR